MKTKLLWPMLYIWIPVTKKMLKKFSFSSTYTNFEINYMSSKQLAFPCWMMEVQ